MKVLDLFSGIGGFSRGLEAAGPFETIAFVEYEPYCQAVLKHHWPRTKILGDIKNVKKDDIPTRPDIIVGGFPCQPFSVAGSRQAQDDPRHLWPDMFRLIQELRPDWVIGENVAGLIHLGLDEVLTDLENAGYTTRTFNIPACAVGAPHQRYRLWIIAHRLSGRDPEPTRPEQQGFDFGDVADTDNTGDRTSQRRTDENRQTHDKRQEEQPQFKSGGHSTDVPNPNDSRLERHGEFTEHASEEGRTDTQRQSSESDSTTNLSDSERVGRETGSAEHGNFARRKPSSEFDRCDSTRQDETFAEGWWESEPEVGRLAHGIPHRVSQLSSLGNSVVPQVVKEIGLAIMEAERGKKT